MAYLRDVYRNNNYITASYNTGGLFKARPNYSGIYVNAGMHNSNKGVS